MVIEILKKYFIKGGILNVNPIVKLVLPKEIIFKEDGIYEYLKKCTQIQEPIIILILVHNIASGGTHMG